MVVNNMEKVLSDTENYTYQHEHSHHLSRLQKTESIYMTS